MNIASWPKKTKKYVFECIRVLKVTKKPTKEEFKTIVKVSGLGMLVVGLIGFLITLVKELLL
ncbi:protein translocase SEC61 complex subunit gamma [Candidatus Woesearchaeota archaeon]|nr:protein translocase SEC61 complex subunit gamma [Candidatus Woesearchaeota archaeon]